jgi:hypothetical protein
MAIFAHRHDGLAVGEKPGLTVGFSFETTSARPGRLTHAPLSARAARA